MLENQYEAWVQAMLNNIQTSCFNCSRVLFTYNTVCIFEFNKHDQAIVKTFEEHLYIFDHRQVCISNKQYSTKCIFISFMVYAGMSVTQSPRYCNRLAHLLTIQRFRIQPQSEGKSWMFEFFISILQAKTI